MLSNLVYLASVTLSHYVRAHFKFINIGNFTVSKHFYYLNIYLRLFLVFAYILRAISLNQRVSASMNDLGAYQ